MLLEVFEGDSITFDFTLTLEDGVTPMNLDNHTLTLRLSEYGALDGSVASPVVHTYAVGSGITVVNAAQGEAQAIIPKGVTIDKDTWIAELEAIPNGDPVKSHTMMQKVIKIKRVLSALT